MTPVLIACSHGTSSLDGRAAISDLVENVRLLLPGVAVEEAFVDVQQPEIDDVVRATAPRDAIVVPLLLSTGFHTKVDIARAVTDAGHRATATAALGPHPLLADLLATRLREVGLAPGDAVVLAAAGSSDPAASVDVAAMADLLRERVAAPVSVGFAAGGGTRIDAAVSAARDAGARRVVAASYVLAPGFFADVIARAGADAVTTPLAPDAAVAAVVVERYLAAVRAPVDVA
ncbi:MULTISPECIES: sirohydrochlorin chelatase [Microbacterium]|uniref:CbiX/SirB N-terminal domain-containing protein n=1 Tax=Microbacterium aquilitoris TaxID=3067307 RepID=A0ABU3GEX4_9MICO|nr:MULTISPECIES: CbiX/SirB N-terminal domain-containing protein [unclassified Microbacterium]MDT3329247.1 CbiX/SirB N-terminal domain-containing protein [Microbacterium sp. KSW-18]MDT3345088.1 CbiX/SirB N-terminal domain-containing protein [Microbacterium sp. KSW2-22]SDG62611.1 Sirohydrochlorin ferrochelatase [Microbacterium sp. 77mftsu3.1]